VIAVEELEELAQELVVRIRDDEPESVRRWLTAQLPNPADWFRLCFVLACAVPDDRSWKALTAWTVFGLNRPATAEVRELQPCGTRSAYQRHLAHGEEPCQDCAYAAREYNRNRKRAQRGVA
jgi:hypothetical protein